MSQRRRACTGLGHAEQGALANWSATRRGGLLGGRGLRPRSLHGRDRDVRSNPRRGIGVVVQSVRAALPDQGRNLRVAHRRTSRSPGAVGCHVSGGWWAGRRTRSPGAQWAHRPPTVGKRTKAPGGQTILVMNPSTRSFSTSERCPHPNYRISASAGKGFTACANDSLELPAWRVGARARHRPRGQRRVSSGQGQRQVAAGRA